MLGWAIGFFVAAIVAALFGFGAIASTFAGIAQLLFWVFVVLFVLSFVSSFFTGAASVVEGEPVGYRGPSGLIGVLFAVIAIAVLVYAWRDNHWSAEKVGRSLDHAAADLSADASDAIHRANNRAQDLTQDTGNAIRHDAGTALDNAQHAVEPARDNTDQGKRR